MSYCGYADRRDLLSFPTRRSSDLAARLQGVRLLDAGVGGGELLERLEPLDVVLEALAARSEEHTSELQSHSELVCRLLLEKKNGTSTDTPTRPSAAHRLRCATTAP